MTKIIVVRSPESDHRPEKWICNYIINQLNEEASDLQVVDIASEEELTLNNQSFFYDNTTMTKSFANGVLKVIAQVEDGDVVYFSDAWCPAIPMLKFHLYCSDIHNVKLCGLFHSSVETPGDFLFEGGKWVRQLEANLLEMLDEVYVATTYGVQTVTNNFLVGKANVFATSLPVIDPASTGHSIDLIPFDNRPYRVVFNHRWAADKRPQDYVWLAQRIRSAYEDHGFDDPPEFVVLHPFDMPVKDKDKENINFILCDNKQKYWKELSKARVVFSSATLETFGYSVIDGIVMDTNVLVPDRACYPHMYAQSSIYHSRVEAEDMLVKMLKAPVKSVLNKILTCAIPQRIIKLARSTS